MATLLSEFLGTVARVDKVTLTSTVFIAYSLATKINKMCIFLHFVDLNLKAIDRIHLVAIHNK